MDAAPDSQHRRTPAVTRRGALLGFGGAGLAAVLAACGGSTDPGASSSSAPPSTGAGIRGPGGASSTNGSLGASGTITSGAAVGDGFSVADFEQASTCSVTPEQTEGPYYLDLDQVRSDIRDSRDGALLRLGIRVLDRDGCTPVDGAMVEIWHCDASGTYSGFEAGEGATFLRGGQPTSGEGIASFATIYPGWYSGRTVHIHVKVLLSDTEVLTSQLYFDDGMSDRIYERQPYSGRSGRQTTNQADGLASSGGGTPMLTLTEHDDGSVTGVITLTVAT